MTTKLMNEKISKIYEKFNYNERLRFLQSMADLDMFIPKLLKELKEQTSRSR